MATAPSTAKISARKTSDRSSTDGAPDHAGMEDIGAQLDRLTRDIAALTRTVADFGSGKAEEAARKARDLGDAVVEKSTEAASDAKRRISDAGDDLEERIRAHPLAAVGIAAGVGFLVALTTRR